MENRSSMKREHNAAFIDGANLHKGIQELGWKLDYKKFRKFLRDKYHIGKVYLFLGFIPKNDGLYRDLRNWGYTLIFKETVAGTDGKIKGNCDAELVLQVVSDYYEKKYDKALLVSGDGDYACLVKFLKERNSLEIVLSPSTHKKCSILLKKVTPVLIFLNELRDKLEYKKIHQRRKAPDQD